MLNNLTNKELCKLLAKELITLDMSLPFCEDLKQEMKEMTVKLLTSELDSKTLKNLTTFKYLMDGNLKTPLPQRNEDDTDNEEDDENDGVRLTMVSSVTSVANGNGLMEDHLVNDLHNANIAERHEGRTPCTIPTNTCPWDIALWEGR